MTARIASVFAKVLVRLPRHHRFLRIPREGNARAAALGAWLAALLYSRGEELDGFVPADEIEAIATADVVARLVDAGLFAADVQDGVHGFRVLKYADFNETKAEIQKRMKADRIRKKSGRIPDGSQPDPPKHRRKHPERVQSDSDRNHAGLPASEGEGEKERDLTPLPPADGGSGVVPVAREIRNATDDGAMGMTVEAWCDGVRQAKGSAITRPVRGVVLKLIEAQGNHRPVDADPVEWSRSSADEFTRAAIAAGRELTAFAYISWLDSEKRFSGPVRPVSEAPSRKRIPPLPPKPQLWCKTHGYRCDCSDRVFDTEVQANGVVPSGANSPAKALMSPPPRPPEEPTSDELRQRAAQQKRALAEWEKKEGTG